MKRQPQKLLPFLLAALLAGAMTWYYEVYVHWNQSIFPLAVAATLLVFLALAASVVRPGKTRKKWLAVLGWFVAFVLIQQGVSFLINNVIHNARGGARPAMRVVLPLLAVLVLLLLVKPLRALSRKVLLAMVGIPLALLCVAWAVWAVPAHRPLPEFVPAEEAAPTVVEKHSISGYTVLDYGNTAAANLIADTLSQITGEIFPVRQGAPALGGDIMVGYFGIADELAEEEYSIMAHHYQTEQAERDSILITGGSPRAVLYGAYRFLEEYFDCHWYTDNLAVIPQDPAEIAVGPENEYERYAPPLEFRETDWISPRDPVFSVANGLNGNVYRDLPEELGGTVGYNGGMCHTIINNFLRPDDFFEMHPDWYAWRESGHKRVPRQLCLTNPEVLEEMIREVRAQLADGNGQRIVSVTQDDNGDFCQCENCKRVDEEEGSHAGTMLRFVNAIADDVKDDYPDALIDTFAYQYTRTPPKHVRPLPNVIVRLCSIECCFAHPLDDPNCPDNTAFAGDIKTWSEICDRLYIWDYTTNFGQYNCVYPNFGVLQRNMQFFVKHNVKGVYEEGNYQAAQCDSEFAALRAYLLARLMMNPDIDYDAEMNGFLKAYYGGGWQYMREFIDLMCANAGTPGPLGKHRKMGIGPAPTDKALLNLGPNQVSYADRLWAKAIELAGSEACKQNVLRSQLSWRFWKACNRAGEFTRLQWVQRWQAANKKLYNDFKTFGITRYSEGSMLAEAPVTWWGTPENWKG